MDITDEQIVNGLINRDNYITNTYFLQKYRPLFIKAISLIFDYTVDKDECINELYIYLMKDNAAKLRSFQGKSTFGCWLKMVTIRFFKDLRNAQKVIDNTSQEPPYIEDRDSATYTHNTTEAKIDLESLFDKIENKRYVDVIRALVIEEAEPEHIARFMGITIANLYNIKKRALAALAKVAIKERQVYENRA